MATVAQVATQQTQPAAVVAISVANIQRPVDCLRRLVVAGLALITLFVCAPSFAGAQALRALYASQREQLAHNAFQAPINLISEVTDNLARGEVYAVVATPFDSLLSIMSNPADWCELVILHVNVKACTYSAEPDVQLRFYIGHKEYETPDQAFALQYRFHVMKATPAELSVTLFALEGPFGTSGYHMKLEAIPLDANHSFLHFSYDYNYNWLSRLALEAYLATLGRDKVGFTVTGHDEKQDPIYIKGIQGIVERNSMRYFLAIQATLDTVNTTPQANIEARFNRWYELIQRYPRQLVDYTREEYLDRKQRELANQQALQRQIVQGQ